MTTPSHLKTIDSPGGAHRFGRGRIAVAAGALIVLAGLTVGVVAITDKAAPAAKSLTGTSGQPGGAPSPPVTHPTPTTLPPIVPLAVRSITPAVSATGVAPASPITITFSTPPAATAPAPTLSPPVAGRWSRLGVQWSFHPRDGYIPTTKETVSIPASVTASEEGRQVSLAAAYSSSFTVGPGSVLRLQQLLAELHYLPITYTPAAGAARLSTAPQRGAMKWAYPNIPASLASQWTEGKADELTLGAVMAFEADQGIAVDGVAGPGVWTALLHAVATRAVDPRPYSYIEVSEGSPETLTVWQNGNPDVYSTPANTGVEGANTAQGTFPVYLRYTSTTMIGTDVDGTKYDDPDIPWVAYFNGGDAIHGYPREYYGYPQSNGCVELPIGNAEQVFNSGDDWYGTLVYVY
jgi:peptidoglycan hydrolase-like protein with peptidoglycan-binding domain